VEDAIQADGVDRSVRGERSSRDEPDVAFIWVARELASLSVAAGPTAGDQLVA